MSLPPLLLTLALGLSAGSAAAAVAQDPQQDQEEPTLARGQALLDEGKLEAAIRTFRGVLEREPDHPAAWYYLGYALHVSGRLDEALDAHIRASKYERTCRVATYNAACALALLGRKEEAFEWLQDAIDKGFDNRRLLRTDPDLNSLRSDPRYARMLPPSPEEELFEGDVRVLFTFVGESPGDQFGWEGRNAGDADGDGKDDILLSAPYKTIRSPNAGKVYLYSGATGKLLFARTGTDGEQLGIGIERAGDVNGDGHADVIVGASRGGNGPGRAYVFSGKDGATLLELQAGEAGDKFGWQVSGTGDLNRDGHDDLMIGAPGSDEAGENAGRVYVYSGKDGSELVVIDGEEPGDEFGGCVAGHTDQAGNLLVVGAGNAGPHDRGAAYVFEYAAGDVSPRFTIQADDTGANLGRMFLSVVGDLDADGVRDVYASDWENWARGAKTGRVYVHSGRTGERLLSLTGERAGDGFGIGPAVAGDADGDGHDDLVIGAWQNCQGAPTAGKAYLYSGRDGELLHEYVCLAPGETFGFDAVGMGDLDGDGGVDFLITAAWSKAHGDKSGRAFVVAGPTPPGD